MTGRELVDYILINHYDDCELVVYGFAENFPVVNVVLEPTERELTVFTRRSLIEAKDED